MRMPEGRGAGAGSDRRNADAARAIKQFLRASAPAPSTIEVHVIGPVRNAAAIARVAGFPVTGFTRFVSPPKLTASLRLPSFSYRSKSIGKDREFGEHGGEPSEQRAQPLLWHRGDEVVEHAALAEQRMGASLGRI